MEFPDANGETRKHDGKIFQVVIRQLLVTESGRKRARRGLEPYCERDASLAKRVFFRTVEEVSFPKSN